MGSVTTPPRTDAPATSPTLDDRLIAVAKDSDGLMPDTVATGFAEALVEHLEDAIAGRCLLDHRIARVVALSRGRLLSAARVALLAPPPLPTCEEYQRRRARLGYERFEASYTGQPPAAAVELEPDDLAELGQQDLELAGVELPQPFAGQRHRVLPENGGAA